MARLTASREAAGLKDARDEDRSEEQGRAVVDEEAEAHVRAPPASLLAVVLDAEQESCRAAPNVVLGRGLTASGPCPSVAEPVGAGVLVPHDLGRCRCIRCRMEVTDAMDTCAQCAVCGDVVHGRCLHPPVTEAACEMDIMKDWLCDVCVQQEALLGAHASEHYSFCVVCAEGPAAGASLAECSSCRGSFHPSCAGLCNAKRVSGDWLCPHCSPGSTQVELTRWSLEVVAQRGGRFVPVVRGVRSDVKAPAGCGLWRTSEIIHVVAPNLLITRTRMVVRLAGHMSRKLAAQMAVPPRLLEPFSGGFPPHAWAVLIQYAFGPPPPAIQAALEGSQASEPGTLRGPSSKTAQSASPLAWLEAQAALVPVEPRDPVPATSAPGCFSFDWIGGLLELPDSASRTRTMPSLRVCPEAASSVVAAFSTGRAARLQVDPSWPSETTAIVDASAGAPTSTPFTAVPIGPDVSIGTKVRRLFRDGWFVGRIAALGSDPAGRSCALLAYDDGLWEIISAEDVAELSRGKRLRTSTRPDGRFEEDDGSELMPPRKRLRGKSSGVAMPGQGAAGSWTCEHTVLLNHALKEFQPTLPRFWQSVAAYVGRGAAECQRHAFGHGRDGRRQATREGFAPEAPPPDPAAQKELPRADGPRRAKRLRELLATACFGKQRDFLDVRAVARRSHPAPPVLPEAAGPATPTRTTRAKAEEPDCPVQRGFSPGSLEFLGSLTTGCTPKLDRRLRPTALFASPEDGGGSPAVVPLAASFSQWQPAGLDGFLCEARARRAGASRPGKRGAACEDPKGSAAPRADELDARDQVSQAPRLLREVDEKMATAALANRTYDSDDEALDTDSDAEAPVAFIPPPPTVGGA